MVTGLIGTNDNKRDWVLEFCGFKYPEGDPRGVGAWDLAPKAGGKSKGEGITIVHPDTGYTEHPELLGDMRYRTSEAWNFVEGWKGTFPGLPAEDYLIGPTPSHGTSTASVIMSAEGHPNPQPPSPARFPSYSVPQADFVSGIVPMAEVIPLRVTLLDSVVLTDISANALARAIWYAIDLEDERVGVISVSLGYFPATEITKNMLDALRAARDAGIVVCAAAGQIPYEPHSWTSNFALPDFILNRPPAFPSSDPNTICCAACNYLHSELYQGFYGPQVDITAPGINIWIGRSLSSYDQSVTPPAYRHIYRIEQSTGSSYSAAIVAGACALWQAHHGRANLIRDYGKPLIFDLFKKVLQDSCHKPPGWDTSRRGAGVLDAKALLNEPLPEPP